MPGLPIGRPGALMDTTPCGVSRSIRRSSYTGNHCNSSHRSRARRTPCNQGSGVRLPCRSGSYSRRPFYRRTDSMRCSAQTRSLWPYRPRQWYRGREERSKANACV